MPSHLEELRKEIDDLKNIASVSPLAAVLAAGSIAESTFYASLHLDTRTSGESFFEWIRALEDHGILDRRVAQCLHGLRVSVNRCRHQGERPTLDEACSLVEDLEYMLESLQSVAILARCDCCSDREVPIRIRLKQYFAQPGRGKRAVCPRRRQPLRTRFNDIDLIERE